MSLLAHRPPAAMERASVVLPTVKCSSCATEIPLNSLGEHVCPPMPAFNGAPPSKPKGRSIPSSPSGSRQRSKAPSNLRNESYGPGELVAPNRFGDYPADMPMSATSVSSMGHWPVDAHLAPGQVLASPTMQTMPDTTSGGNAGMAGVGRRAFAAAAWSVRAGVALAAGSGRGFNTEYDGAESAHSHTPSPPLSESPPMPVPMPYAAAHQHQQSGSSLRSTSPLVTATGPNARPHREPSQKEPVILPKAPLAERQRGDPPRKAHGRKGSRDGAVSRADCRPGASSRADDYRSASRNDQRSGSRNDDYRSPSRAGPSRSGSRADEYSARAEEERAASRAQLERSASSQSSQADSRPFFDKYNQLIGSKSDQTHGRSRNASPASPIEDDRESVTSAGEPSALPWATESESDDHAADPFERIEHQHRRYPTDGSISSDASSYYGPPDGRSSSHENEMVMTPSQSWEGLSSVDAPPKGYFDSPAVNGDAALPNSLAEIGEEDETEEEDEDEDGERMVFGAPNPLRRDHMPRSSSASTVTPTNAHRSSPSRPHRELDPPRIPLAVTPQRSRTEPPLSTSPPTTRPKRVCAKCGDTVGGLRRYVERDGIVLCEADWKKMYLPACRRCKLPIEKSAVSSSDGQLKGKWHRACFTCTRCDSPFEGDDFYVHRGRPWCQFHYAEEK